MIWLILIWVTLKDSTRKPLKNVNVINKIVFQLLKWEQNSESKTPIRRENLNILQEIKEHNYKRKIENFTHFGRCPSCPALAPCRSRSTHHSPVVPVSSD
jgi:hypothetical protein